MRYPHSLTITRASEGGTTDPNTGVFTPAGPDVEVYDGLVDAQESGDGFGFDGTMLKTVRADLVIFLKDESAVFSFKVGDTGTLTRRGHEEQISVKKIIIMDGSIEANIDE